MTQEIPEHISRMTDEALGWLESRPQPLPEGRPEVRAFDPDLMLPEDIAKFVVDVAGRQQAPVDFAATCSVALLSGLIGRRALIQPKRLDCGWRFPANLWGAIIGRPSAMKSPSLAAVLSPLRDLEQAALAAYERDVRDYEIDAELTAMATKEAKEAARKKIKAGDHDDARAALEGVHQDQSEPLRRRYVVNDATVEKLGELLKESPNGLVLVRDELSGWLARLGQEQFQVDRAFYLEAYNGTSSFTHDRIGRGTIEVPHLCLAVIGGIQPSKLAPIIRGAHHGSSDDGLIQRMQLAVWPDDVKSWHWIDRAPDHCAEKRFRAVFQRLDELPTFEGDQEAAPAYCFSRGAQKIFAEWMEQLQQEVRSGRLTPSMESHLLKLPQTIARLALIFHLIEHDPDFREVRPTTLNRALSWAGYLRSHAERIYAIGSHGANEAARLLSERSEKLPDGFTVRDVYRKNWQGLGAREQVQEALDLLVDYNHLKVYVIDDPGAGRPTVRYFWRYDELLD